MNLAQVLYICLAEEYQLYINYFILHIDQSTVLWFKSLLMKTLKICDFQKSCLLYKSNAHIEEYQFLYMLRKKMIWFQDGVKIHYAQRY